MTNPAADVVSISNRLLSSLWVSARVGISEFTIEGIIFYAVTMSRFCVYASEAKPRNPRVLFMFFLGSILLLNDFSKAGAQLSFSLSFGPCFVLSSLGKPSTMHDFSRLCFLVFSFSVLHGNSCSGIDTTKMNFIYDNTCPALQIPSGGDY